MPGEHLDFSCAHPSHKLGDHLFPGAEGNRVSNVAQVGLEATGDVDDPESSLEASDLEPLSGELLAHLLLTGAACVQFLAGVEGAMMDGGDEAVGDGLDGF